MKSSKTRFAFVGLILAIVGAVAALILALIKGIQMLGLYTPKTPQSLNLPLEISLGVVILGLGLYALLAPDKVRAFLTGRQARYGSNALILSLAFIGILGVVNLLIYQHPKQFDLTEGQQHTLAPETLNMLKALPQKVTATAFFSSRASSDTARQLLMDFQASSNGKFEFGFVDPDLNPLQAQNAGITGDGKILLQMGDQKEIATSATEQELDKALIRLINPQKRVIYFVTGNGERDIQNAGDASLSDLRTTLEDKNYTVQTLNLAAENQIPDDATVIVVAGPLKPLSSAQVDLLSAYLDKGGKLIVMEDPIPLTNFGEASDPLASYLADQWGITLDNDIVVDPHVSPASHAFSYQYGDHAITQKMNNVGSFFPYSRSLEISSHPDNVDQTDLVQTIDQAWGETDFSGLQNGQLQYDQGADFPGPLSLAVAAINSSTKARLVVFGSSEFPTDQYYNSSYGNADLMVNSIDWAAEQEATISLTPKQPVQRQFKYLDQLQLIAALLGSICLIPGLVLIGGVSAWLGRRKRG